MESVSTRGLRDYAAHVVRSCDLDSASVFLCDRSAREPKLVYFCHIGVADEVAHTYLKNNIFRDDPFTDPDLNESPERPEGLIARHDRRIVERVSQSGRYARFMRDYGFAAVGASVRRVGPGIYSVIGLHRFSGDSRGGRAPVAMAQLDKMSAALQDMAMGHVLQRIADNPSGIEALRMACFAAHAPLATLSPRQSEIAALVARGHQNKAIAHLAGLSENTVENHLRRIYAKLGIRNRAALAGMMAGTRH